MRWLALAWLAACGDNRLLPDAALPDDARVGDDATADDGVRAPRTVFVIVMENTNSTAIYGNTTDAPYINSALSLGASATNMVDELPNVPSEPHYIWMEAGTNAFADHTFTTDLNATAANSTSSTEHLSTQLTAAGIPWVTYQQGMKVGTCPIAGFGAQVAKHDPFVFFHDVAGNPPSLTAPDCIAHHKPYSEFETDLAAGLEGYVFIVPDQCHDMHGQTSCAAGTNVALNVQAGDTFLSTEMPRIIDYTASHDAILFLTWDEPRSGSKTPFLLIGKGVKVGYTSDTAFDHSTQLKTVERYLGVPVLPTVENANDFGELFETGQIP